jgi:hypothetical protein
MSKWVRYRGVFKLGLAVLTAIILVVGWEALASYNFTLGGSSIINMRLLFILGLIGLIFSAAYDLRRNQ